MNNLKQSNEVCDLTARVDAIIAYWKSVAGKRFRDAHPFSDPSEFEKSWPKTLDNFFLAETVRTVKLLRSLPSESRDN